MYFLGIDLGTSSVKVLVTNDKNEIVGEASRAYPVDYFNDNWAEQNPSDWWTGTVECIKEVIDTCKMASDEVAGISFSGQMHGLVALDNANEVLRPCILWCDNRPTQECEDITAHFGQDKLTELVGNKALTGFTIPKVMWVKNNEPEIFEKIEHIMLPKDYINFMLTGDYATDVSDASGMLCLDVKNRTWSKEILDYVGITEAMLPKLHESYEVTGYVQESVLAELGLTGKVAVIAGAGDQAAGAIGTGTVESGVVSVTLGTSGVVFAAHEEYAVDADGNRLHAFCHSNGKYHSMGVMLSAANCLKWWVESANNDGDFMELLAEAEAVEAGAGKVVFLPYLTGERTPYADPNAKGTFIGMDMNTTRGHLTRAVLEGVAFGLRDSLEILKDLNVPIDAIRVIGGGAQSPLWKQILADVFGMTIQEINTNQGGGLGACIMAATGVGHFENVEEGCATMIKVVNEIDPINSNIDAYNDKYPKYQKLYGYVKDYFKEL
jgi:xylulokinase